MATKIGLVLALDGEKEFSAGLKQAASNTKLMKQELKNVESEYKNNANSLDALKSKQEALNKVQAAVKKQLDAANAGYNKANDNYQKISRTIEEYKKKIKDAQESLNKMESAGEKNSDAYKEQSKAIDSMTAELRDLELQRTKENTALNKWATEQRKAQGELKSTNTAIQKNDKYLEEAEKSADHCATSIDELGKEVKETGKDFQQAGKDTSRFGDMLKANITADLLIGALKALGQAALDAGKFAVDVGSAFEAEMSKVGAISGATTEELQQMSDKAQELGASTMFSASEVASAFEYMSLAGWNTQQSIAGIEGVLNLAAVSGMELAGASDMVTDSLSAFKLEAEDGAHLVDMLATAQANSNTSAEQMGEAYGTAAANLTTAGQSAETVTAILSGMADVGDKGSAAGTKLSAIMAQITAKMKDGAIAIGDTTVAVTDQNGNFRDLIDIIADVETATDGMGSAERSAALATTFNRTSLAGLNEILAEGTGQIRNYKEMLEQCDGAAANMATQITDNLQGDMTEFSSATEGLGIAVYDYLNGPLRQMVQFATKAISGLTDILTPQKTTLETFIDDVKKSNEEVNAVLDTVEGRMNGASSAVTNLEAYKNMLMELNGKTELNEYEQYQLKKAIDDVGDSVPGLADAYDSLNGTLNLTNEELESLFKNAEINAEKQAYLAASAEALEANAKAHVNVAKAQAAETEAIQLLNEELGKNYESYNDIEPLEFAHASREVKNAVQDAHEAVEAANEGLERSAKDLDITRKAYEDATQSANDYENELYGLNGTADDQRKEQQMMREATKGTTEALEELTDAEGEAAEETYKMTDSQKAAISAMEGVRDQYHQLHEDIRKDVEDKIDLFDTFDGGDDQTVEQMLANLNSGLEGVKNWEANLQQLSQYVGDVISPEFYNYLLSMGTDGANAIQHMITTLDQQGEQGKDLIKQMSDSWMESLNISDEIAGKFALTQLALQAGLNQIGSTQVDFSNLKNNINYAVDNALGEWGRLAPETQAQLQATVSAAEAMGVKIPDGLAKGIIDGTTKPQEAIDQLTEAMSGTMDGILTIAEEMGVKVPETISEKISAGGNEALAGYQELLDLLANTDVDLSAGGKQGAETFSEGLSDSTDATTAAEGITTAVAEELGNHTDEYTEAGKSSEEAYAEGLSDTGKATEAANKNTKAVIDAIKSKNGEMQSIGQQQGRLFADGVASQQSAAQNAARAVAQAAAAGAQGYSGSFYSAGLQMAAGMASGINSGASMAINAAISMASRSLAAAKAALSIKSPSRKFKNEVGAMIPLGVAAGIKGTSKEAEKASAAMSQNIYNRATVWLKNYKKDKEVSLQDEQWYWEQIAKRVKVGTSEYAKAMNKIADLQVVNQSKTGKAMAEAGASIAESAKAVRQMNNAWGVTREEKDTEEDYMKKLLDAAKKYAQNRQTVNNWSLEAQKAYFVNVQSMLKKESQAWYDAQNQINSINEQIVNDRIATSDKYIERGKLTGKISLADEVAYWKQMLKSAKKGTDEYYEYYSRLKDARESYYQEELQKAETYAERQKMLGKMGAIEEVRYWQEMLKTAKKGSDQYYEILSKVQSAKANKNSVAANNSSNLLSTYMTYMKVSNKQQMQYWAIMRKSAKAYTNERIQMDANYLQARQAYYDELQEIDENYQSKTRDINNNLKESVQSLTDAYNDAVDQRKSQILSMSMFESYDPTGYDADTLIENIRSQVGALALWEKELANLKKRGISQDLYAALAEAGPDAAANVYSISRMTDEQLAAYQKLFDQRNALAQRQAEIDSSQLRADTERQIAELKTQAREQLGTLYKEYRSQIKEANTGISEDMKNQLREMVSTIADFSEEEINKMALGLRDALGGTDIVDKYSVTGVKEKITKDLATLPSETIEIGENALEGLLAGLQNSKKIEETSTEVVDNIKREMQAAALIHSPSKLMRDEIGMYLGEGVAMGIEDSIPLSIAKTKKLMDDIVESARTELNAALMIDNIADLNESLANINVPQPIVNIDNSALNARLSDMTRAVTGMQNNLLNMKVVLSSGEIVGYLQPLLSYQNAMIVTRSGRGRL